MLKHLKLKPKTPVTISTDNRISDAHIDIVNLHANRNIDVIPIKIRSVVKWYSRSGEIYLFRPYDSMQLVLSHIVLMSLIVICYNINHLVNLKQPKYLILISV